MDDAGYRGLGKCTKGKSIGFVMKINSRCFLIKFGLRSLIYTRRRRIVEYFINDFDLISTTEIYVGNGGDLCEGKDFIPPSNVFAEVGGALAN